MLIDSELELWREYENEGWPARYLFDGRARLFEYHFGEGAYAETERRDPGAAGRRAASRSRRCVPRTRRARALAPPSADREGAYGGPYEAGGVWAVLDGAGTVRVNEAGRRRRRGHDHASRRLPAARAPRDTPSACSRSSSGDGVRLPGDLLHAWSAAPMSALPRVATVCA